MALEESQALDVFVARQPIYDRDLGLCAYELLFRDEDVPMARIEDAELATAKVLLHTFTEIGLDAIVGDRPAYINVSRRFLLDQWAFELPQDRVVLEVLEDSHADADLVAALRSLAARGYTIALDDFALDTGVRRLLELASVVKLDVLALGREGVQEHYALLRPLGVRLLAEKVESYEDFEFCKELGFDLFQGYFFCRPKIIRGRGVPTNRLMMLRLLERLAASDVEVEELEGLISRDVGLSYRLLRYINSAFFSLPREVDSTRQALLLLGLDNVRRWATLLALAGVDDKPSALIVTALARARMCELLASALRESDPQELFTVGLFSVVDAVMDAPMAEVLAALPFTDELKRALIGQEGRKGRVLRCALACERGDVERARAGLPEGTLLGALYLEAQSWADAASAALA